MKLVITKRGGTLKVLEPGDRLNPAGRPKKTVATVTSARGGYTLHEIKIVISCLLALSPDEIKLIPKMPHATVLEITVARALLNGFKRSSLYNLETLLSRVYGKPKETMETPDLNDVELTLNIGV